MPGRQPRGAAGCVAILSMILSHLVYTHPVGSIQPESGSGKALMQRAPRDRNESSNTIWFKPRTWSFSVHLALTMVVLASVALTGLTVVSIRRVQSALSNQIGHQLEAQAQSLNNIVLFFLLDKISDLRVLATSDDILEAAEARNQGYTGDEVAILEGILAQDKAWVAAQGSVPLLDEVTSRDRNKNPAAFQLGRFLENFREHSELLLTDRRGATTAATGRLSDYYQADEDWWKFAWEAGKGHVYISPPRYDESAGITAMLIAVPVYNGGEEPVGILRSTLNVADVLGVISSVSIGKTGQAYLMDAEGKLFRTPGAKEGTIPGAMPDSQLISGFEDKSGHRTDARAIVAHARLVRENFELTAIPAVDNAIVDAVTGLGLVIVVQQDRDEALATVSAIQSSGLVALCIAVAASVFIALFAARIVTKPLKRLSLAAEAMGRGRLDTPLPEAYSGEITHLTENLATMAQRLQELIASLEARSLELADSNQSLMREVSVRIRAERELRSYRDQLEDRIEERTRELKEAQSALMRREKLATLGQLTEKIAQEIRSPLGTVAASLYVLKNTLRNLHDERLEGILVRADRSVKRCDRIVSELFAYSDRQTPTLQETLLDTWLESVLENVEFPPAVEFSTSLNCGISLSIDRESMRQAIECIVLNAIQAVEECDGGNGTVSVETRSTNSRVEIRIEDTGPGIPLEIMDQIFEPLFSTKPMGIGLGLPLARVILEEHLGGIEIESGQHGGTRVILWIPPTV